MLHYFGFTNQMALLRVFLRKKVKHLVFDTFYHKCMVFYEELW